MWNSKNSGERASGVCNHTCLYPVLFVGCHSGLSFRVLGDPAGHDR